MRLTVRGWGRDMGESEIADYSLSELSIRDDGVVTRGKPPTLFKSWRAVRVHWYQTLRFTGAYRMQLDLTHWDIVKLFKSAFGDELTPEIITKYGFKVSSELEKAALGKVKIADLTVGELVAMIQPASERSPAASEPTQNNK
jgi:hypothetical protein